MWNLLLTNLVVPLAVDGIKKYINSTESKKDDKVLELVQTGASYLAKKPNNTVDNVLASQLEDKSMRPVQKAR